MIYLNAALSQHHSADQLPVAVRAALSKPLRRAAALTQLALIGALACLPKARRHLPTALLWQSTSGARQEAIVLLNEITQGSAEPMPYDFLAMQPAIAATQIQPFLPGLHSAMHFPLEQAGQAHWSLLLTLASNWLAEGRYAQVLCAHLDSWPERVDGHWLALACEPIEKPLASLQLKSSDSSAPLPDTPDFPAHLSNWLHQAASPTLHLQSSDAPRLALKFARL